MKTNPVKQNVPAPLLRAAVAHQLAGDGSAGAHEFRIWLQSKDSTKLTSGKLREHAQLIRDLRELAAQALSGDDQALRQVFASAGNEFAVAEATLLPVFAAALEKAAPLLRAFYSTRILNFAPDDLVLSQHELRVAFEKGVACSIKIREALKAQGVPVDSAEIAAYDKPATLKWNGESFSLKKGRNGPRCCWGIAEEDRARFIRAAKLVAKEGEILPFDTDDLVLSEGALNDAFANGWTCARKIREALKAQGVPVEHAEIAAYDKPVMLKWNGETFSLKKGRSGTLCCWGIAAEDRASFIQAAGLVERQGEILPFDAGDLVLSEPVLGTAFANGNTCAREIREALKAQGVPLDSAEIAGYDKPVMLKWNGGKFSLKKGRRGSKDCWGIAAKDRARFIQAAGLVERQGEILPFDANDVVFSQPALRAAFANGDTCARKIRETLKARGIPVGSAEIAGYDKPVMLKWNGGKFSLKKGRSGSNYCWGIAAEDRARFIQVAGLVERPPYTLQRIGPGEIPLTPEGVAKVFRGKGEDGKELTPGQILARIKAAMRAGSPAKQAPEAADTLAEAE